MSVDAVLRDLAPRVLASLVRRHGRFDVCEDAVQEALIAAATRWPREGMPTNPHGWLVTVASRRLTDALRGEGSRRRREGALAALARHDVGDELGSESDDTLTLLFLCCHPSLSAGSQIALTLRAVGGLTTAEIARAFLVPEATMAQRISRAKQRIKAAGATFAVPPLEERSARLAAVLHVLYLVFNEGYTATSGEALHRADLTAEAIRLAESLHQLLPDDGEVAGLLALMLLTEARRPARTTDDGRLVPLSEQDRSRWERNFIDDGVVLVTRALSRGAIGPYQLQAAIAAVHDEAPTADDTDWRQIVALYGVLESFAPNPMVTLNHTVAVAMVDGPAAGLEMLAALEIDGRLASHHRLDAVRAHLHELAGDVEAARVSYRTAARRTRSLPERRYLEAKAAQLR